MYTENKHTCYPFPYCIFLVIKHLIYVGSPLSTGVAMSAPKSIQLLRDSKQISMQKRKVL